MSTGLLSASAEAIERFDEQGYLILQDFLEPEVIQDVRREMEGLVDEHIRSLAAAGKIKELFEHEPFETRMARVYEKADFDPPQVFRKELHKKGMFRLFFNRHLLDIVSTLLGDELRLYPNYSVRPKLPDNEATLVLWHQDSGYTEQVHKSEEGNVDQLRMVNVWAPIVPATTENGCMQFIPKTHKLGTVAHVQKNKFYLEIAEEYLAPRLAQAVDVTLMPGDVVIFNNVLFHRGLPNRTKAIRWSADWRYQDATQSTLRPERGHLARSSANPDQVVRTALQWSELSFT